MKHPRLICTLAALVALTGCATPVQRNDWAEFDGPGAEHFQREEYEFPYDPDPIEPANRVFAAIGYLVLAGLVDPMATGWRFVVPPPARRAMVNASMNIEYPRRVVNNMLQGNMEGASIETQRFAINSTVGVLGLGDPAAERGLHPVNTDTGMTLNHWGWQESTFLTIPFGQPSTIRDSTGFIGDLVLDPTIYFFPAAPIKGFIVNAERTPGFKRFAETNYDAYDKARRLWGARRRIVSDETPPDPSIDTIHDPDAPVLAGDDMRLADATNLDDPNGISFEPAAPTPADDAAVETVAYSTFSFSDPWFPYSAKTHKATIPTTGKKLPYDCYLQPVRAPLVFLIPGFGGHRQAAPILALAELFYSGGNSVVVMSSPTNFEFMQNAASVTTPGYLPVDAEDAHVALDAIWRDFYKRYGGRVYKRMVVGSSIGGAYALIIAAREGTTDLIDFDAYLAVNPPVQLRHAAATVDEFYNTPLTYEERERDDRVAATLQKAIRLNFPGRRADAKPEVLDANEARFLIGLFYRLALHDVIYISQERLDQGVLKTPRNPMQRAAASQEILDFSVMEYAYAFLLPQMQKRVPDVSSVDELFARSDLRSIETQLRANPKTRVATNANDVMLSAEDVVWLHNVFGQDRLVMHEDGGHLGNLGDPGVRASIIELLDERPTTDLAVRSDAAERNVATPETSRGESGTTPGAPRTVPIIEIPSASQTR